MAVLPFFIGAILKIAPKAIGGLMRSQGGKSAAYQGVKKAISTSAKKEAIANVKEAASIWKSSKTSQQLGLIDDVFSTGKKRESFMRFTPQAQKAIHSNDLNIKALVARAENTLGNTKNKALMHYNQEAGEFIIQTEKTTVQGSEYLALLRIGGKF